MTDEKDSRVLLEKLAGKIQERDRYLNSLRPVTDEAIAQARSAWQAERHIFAEVKEAAGWTTAHRRAQAAKSRYELLVLLKRRDRLEASLAKAKDGIAHHYERIKVGQAAVADWLLPQVARVMDAAKASRVETYPGSPGVPVPDRLFGHIEEYWSWCEAHTGQPLTQEQKDWYLKQCTGRRFVPWYRPKDKQGD